jgi:hypothetical protein
MKIQDWFMKHQPEDEMVYKNAMIDQVKFFRDEIQPLLGRGLDATRRAELMEVVGTHTSKSIVLPVYHVDRPDLLLKVWLRDNFYNTKLSVVCGKELVGADFSGLFHVTPPPDPEYTGNELSPCYFEGFRSEWIFGYYCENKQAWSAEIGSQQELYTVLFLLMRALGACPPFEWNTRAKAEAARAAKGK